MTNLNIEVKGEANAEELSIIDAGLTAACSHIQARNYAPLAVMVRDPNGKLVGGLTGSTYWDHLDIALLWVDESVRGEDLGTKLVEFAEKEARERGCNGAIVDTYSFQAVGFYKKLGYEIFGNLPDFPHGETRYYLKKSLA